MSRRQGYGRVARTAAEFAVRARKKSDAHVNNLEIATMAHILRLREVMERTGLCRSSLYRHLRASERLFVTPVRIGARAVGFPVNEVEAIIAARIAGRTDAEIRELVTQLISVRTGAIPGARKPAPTRPQKTRRETLRKGAT